MMKVSPSSAPPVTGSALAAHRGRGRARFESPARRRAPRRTAAGRHARGAPAGRATAVGCAMDSVRRDHAGSRKRRVRSRESDGIVSTRRGEDGFLRHRTRRSSRDEYSRVGLDVVHDADVRIRIAARSSPSSQVSRTCLSFAQKTSSVSELKVSPAPSRLSLKKRIVVSRTGCDRASPPPRSPVRRRPL